jgi:hypothetical protein
MNAAEQQERAQPQVSDDAYFIVKAIGEDARTQISADAQYIAESARKDAQQASGRIVTHMWIIFVLLPIVLAILFAILK